MRVTLKTMLAAAGAAGVMALGSPASAITINSGDLTFQSLVAGQVHSAVGGLDLILMTGPNGAIADNEFGTTDVDDANTDMPSGGTSTATESYITTAGELQAFYEHAFGANAADLVDEIIIFTDMQQSQGLSMRVEDLRIVGNPSNVTGDPDPLNDDVASSVQNAIGAGFDEAADDCFALSNKLACLGDPVEPITLQQGSGWADWAILTGIDPFALDPDDEIIFYLDGSEFTASFETLFISGRSASIRDVPEPATLGLFGAGLVTLGVLGAARRRGRR